MNNSILLTAASGSGANDPLKVNASKTESFSYHYLIVVLMILSGILGSTIFDEVQMVVEVGLFILLGYALLKIKLTATDIILLFVLLATFLFSVFFTDLLALALNFKLYGLCILTFIYFSKVHFYPHKLVWAVHIINIALILHQFVFGHFIVASAWFFGQYREYANTRPVGIFLSPHASSFFLAVYVIYIVRTRQGYLKALLFFLFTAITASLTSLVSLLAQLSQQAFNYVFSKIFGKRNRLGWHIKLLIIVVPIFLLSIYREQVLEMLQFSSYTRFYSLEQILDQIFDSYYFSDIFKIYSRDYHQYIIGQEILLKDQGNEIGVVKIFVEGGFILGLTLLIVLMGKLRNYNIFIFVSLLHYSFVINMPFMLFLMLFYNYQIMEKEKMQERKQQLKAEKSN